MFSRLLHPPKADITCRSREPRSIRSGTTKVVQEALQNVQPIWHEPERIEGRQTAIEIVCGSDKGTLAVAGLLCSQWQLSSMNRRVFTQNSASFAIVHAI